MRDALKSTLRAACTGVALLLAALLPGCNDFGDDGNGPEAFAEVTKVELVGNSAMDGDDAALVFTIAVKARGGSAANFANDVIIDVVDVVWTPGAVLTSGTSLVNAGWTPVGGTMTITMLLFPDMSEPVGAVEDGFFTFFGRDNNGHTFSINHLASAWFVP